MTSNLATTPKRPGQVQTNEAVDVSRVTVKQVSRTFTETTTGVVHQDVDSAFPFNSTIHRLDDGTRIGLVECQCQHVDRIGFSKFFGG